MKKKDFILLHISNCVAAFNAAKDSRWDQFEKLADRTQKDLINKFGEEAFYLWSLFPEDLKGDEAI